MENLTDFVTQSFYFENEKINCKYFFSYTFSLLKKRLNQFKHVKQKHIIYGGDLGGELAISLMDEVYGKSNYKIYAILLPCYEKTLNAFIRKSLKNRNNVIFLESKKDCIARIIGNNVIYGECSSLLNNALENNKYVNSLEVCGCFYPEKDSLKKFIEWHKTQAKFDTQAHFDEYWSVKKEDKLSFHLYLFSQIPQFYCYLLAMHLYSGKHLEDWDWWRIHVCRSGDFQEHSGNFQQEIWKKHRVELMNEYKFYYKKMIS